MVGLVACLLSLSYLVSRLDQILKRLFKIEAALKPPRAAFVEFYEVLEGGTKRKVTHMNLKIDQNLPLSIAVKDRRGNPAALDGAPAWSVTVPELAVLEVAEDGLSAVLKPTGIVGSLVVQVSGDADLGEGEKTLLGELPVELIAAEAVTIAIAAGEPVDQE